MQALTEFNDHPSEARSKDILPALLMIAAD